MGQKVNPVSFRLQVNNNTWQSIWHVNKREYAKTLHEDLWIRTYIKNKFANAAISKIIIARKIDTINITIHSARPGTIIGKKGNDIDSLKKDIMHEITDKKVEVNIFEIKRPEVDAQLLASNIARQLAGRVSYRRAMKQGLQNALRAGSKGIKISCAGRLGGAEIARTEWYKEGKMPLHTLRSNIDYASTKANTVYGVIGIKVWIYKGESGHKT